MSGPRSIHEAAERAPTTAPDAARAPSPAGAQDARIVAALDLGSNSFHMVIARAVGDELSILDRLRDPVRLAAGLDEQGNLDEETVARALDGLERFAQRLREIPPSRLRVVGTNTLRSARTSSHFLSRARRILGVPVEILPGAEEARLIYLGVAHDLADDAGPRLVVDIGGGSTECVVGERFEARLTDSLEMGCVSFSRRFFPKGALSRAGFKRAELAARVELEGIQERYAEAGWQHCVGSSGTIKAVDEVLRVNGWSESGITLTGIRRLRKTMIAAGGTEALNVPGIQADRAPVFPGGVAILKAIFQGLGIERMVTSQSALREGLLYDLLGRIAHEDVRDRTIASLSQRYRIDEPQARRVEGTALALLDQTAEAWGLGAEDARQRLSWAAALHEIGLAIAYSGFHKHGAYLLEHSNLPGFSLEDQRLLAAIVQEHRRRLDRTVFEALPPFHRELALRLCVLLRLAVQLNRSRSARPLPPLVARASEDGLELVFPEDWLDSHPLTRADLEAETALLADAGLRLEVR